MTSAAAEAVGDALWTLGMAISANQQAGGDAAASVKNLPEWVRLVELVQHLTAKPSSSTTTNDDAAAAAAGGAAASAAEQPALFTAVFLRVLDGEMLAAANTSGALGVPSAEGFEKKLKKLNTDAVYRQQKYNLLREETEGYAKLVVLLGTLAPGGVGAGLTQMRSLIGYTFF